MIKNKLRRLIKTIKNSLSYFKKVYKTIRAIKTSAFKQKIPIGLLIDALAKLDIKIFQVLVNQYTKENLS